MLPCGYIPVSGEVGSGQRKPGVGREIEIRRSRAREPFGACGGNHCGVVRAVAGFRDEDPEPVLPGEFPHPVTEPAVGRDPAGDADRIMAGVFPGLDDAARHRGERGFLE